MIDIEEDEKRLFFTNPKHVARYKNVFFFFLKLPELSSQRMNFFAQSGISEASDIQ